MKRLPALALFALSAALCGPVLAQQSAPAPAGSTQNMHKFDAETQLQRLTKQLTLTPDQQTRIRPVLQQRDQQLQALHGDSSLKPADRRAKAMSIMQDTESQIDGMLSNAPINAAIGKVSRPTISPTCSTTITAPTVGWTAIGCCCAAWQCHS